MANALCAGGRIDQIKNFTIKGNGNIYRNGMRPPIEPLHLQTALVEFAAPALRWMWYRCGDVHLAGNALIFGYIFDFCVSGFCGLLNLFEGILR